MDESFDANEMINVVHDKNDANDDDDVDENEVTNDKCDNDKVKTKVSDPRKASAEILRRDQKSDRSLINCWSLADRQRAGYYIRLAVWLSGNALASINVVALRQTRLVLGWVAVCGRVNHFGM